MTEIEAIFDCLKYRRLSLTNEKKTQSEIAEAFDECGIPYEREFRLDNHNIIDFIVDDIGIEIKIKSPRMKLLRQVERYAEFDAISCIILAINVATGFPPEINGKPVFVLNLAKAWL
jgi:hypothetical protein